MTNLIDDAAAAPMDLADFAAQDVVEFQPTHPGTNRLIIGSDKKPWTWVIAGPGHDVSIQQRNRSMRDVLREQRRPQRERDEINEQEAIRKSTAFTAARVLGWSPMVFDGKDLPFSAQAVIDLLGNPRFSWLSLQLSRFMQDDASFLRQSPGT